MGLVRGILEFLELDITRCWRWFMKLAFLSKTGHRIAFLPAVNNSLISYEIVVVNQGKDAVFDPNTLLICPICCHSP